MRLEYHENISQDFVVYIKIRDFGDFFNPFTYTTVDTLTFDII